MGSSSRHTDRDRERDRSSRDDESRGHRHPGSTRRRSRERDDSRERQRHREERDRRKERDSEHRSHHHSSSHRRRHDDDEEERDRKRSRHESRRDRDEGHRSSHHGSSERRRHRHDISKSDVDVEDALAHIPTSESLALTSSVHPRSERRSPSTADIHAQLPHGAPSQTAIGRDDWMLASKPGGQSDSSDAHPHARHSEQASSTNTDFFASLGVDREKSQQQLEKEAAAAKRDPEKLQVNSRELNTQFAQGKSLDEYDDGNRAAKRPEHGAPGWQWRMMKLRKVFETAEAEGRPVEELALERYVSMDAFEEAKAEKAFLDARESSKRRPGGSRQQGDRERPVSYMFSETSSMANSPLPGSRPMSRQGFKKPGQPSQPGTPSAQAPPVNDATPGPSTPSANLTASSSKSSTPIPSVFAPVVPRKSSALANDAVRQAAEQRSEKVDSTPPLDATAINKLQAKVLKAEMMGAPNASQLKEEYEREKKRADEWAQKGGDAGDGYLRTSSTGEFMGVGDENRHVHVLPTLDGRGRLYDVGKGTHGDEAERLERLPGNRRRKLDKVEMRDPKTGEVVRYNADDDQMSLADMVREERFSAGAATQKNFDAELGSRIMNDAAFKTGVDYMDDNVERMARKKMKSDAMKRQFAIQDFARTKQALDTCPFCWQNDGATPPRANVISSGTRAYLALPERESLVEDHCYIVPAQHYLSSLEMDDDDWDEVKNFMKCLIQMAAKRNHGMIFFETILSFKQQKHTYIECLSVPWNMHQDAPAYFKESLLASEQEWTQHNKVIDFSKKGFRGSMISKLPYFMVQFDHRGFKGYGHVIEGQETAEQGENGEVSGINESGLGGQSFPWFFAQEIVGNLLDLEPRKWRRPRRLDPSAQASRTAQFKARWSEFDWTKMLDQAAS